MLYWLVEWVSLQDQLILRQERLMIHLRQPVRLPCFCLYCLSLRAWFIIAWHSLLRCLCYLSCDYWQPYLWNCISCLFQTRWCVMVSSYCGTVPCLRLKIHLTPWGKTKSATDRDSIWYHLRVNIYYYYYFYILFYTEMFYTYYIAKFYFLTRPHLDWFLANTTCSNL